MNLYIIIHFLLQMDDVVDQLDTIQRATWERAINDNNLL